MKTLITLLLGLTFGAFAQNQNETGYLRLNDTAPDFTVKTTVGTINFYKWLGNNWGILFSHPADFTPVCTTELGAAAKLKAEFEKLGVKIIALSVDPIESHFKWIGDINETQGVEMNFPIIADPEFKVASLYGMVHPNASAKATVRSVFIIGPDKKVKLMITYPASTGRNFAEILRVVESLQLTSNYSVATPANWQHGEDVIIVPSVKDEEIPVKFPKGHKAIKPYLRTTPQPNLK
jgi:alkyl hydroperoxide reductase subunit AhpC